MLLKPAILLLVLWGRTQHRLDAFLPASVKEQPLLRRVAELSFVPPAIHQNPQLLEKLADERGFFIRYWYIVSGPGIGADLVRAPAGVAASLGFHLEQDKVAEAPFVEAPGGRQSRHAAAHNNQGDLDR